MTTRIRTRTGRDPLMSVVVQNPDRDPDPAPTRIHALNPAKVVILDTTTTTTAETIPRTVITSVDALDPRTDLHTSVVIEALAEAGVVLWAAVVVVTREVKVKTIPIIPVVVSMAGVKDDVLVLDRVLDPRNQKVKSIIAAVDPLLQMSQITLEVPSQERR
jgi:hypothetical protein